MKNVWLLIPVLALLAGCAASKTSSMHHDNVAFARVAADRYAHESCADNLVRIERYVALTAQARLDLNSECMTRISKEHYLALMQAFAADPALSRPYPILSSSAPARYDNDIGPYGSRGPSWSQFNYAYQFGVLSPAPQLQNQQMQLQNHIQNHQLQMQMYQRPAW